MGWKFREVCCDDGFVGAIRLGTRYVWGALRLAALRRVARTREATCRLNGHRMITRIDDPGIGRELVEIGCHEKIATREMLARIEPGTHAIDIGANIGYFTLLLGNLAGRDGLIHALEPVPDTYALLKRNVQLNGFEDRVRTYPMAIGDCSEPAASMRLSRFMSQHSMLGEPHAPTGETIDIPVQTFTDFVDANAVDLNDVSFLRMDIEGYEAVILPDIVRALPRTRSVEMHIEFHPAYINASTDHSFKELMRELKASGVRLLWVLDHDGRRKLHRHDVTMDDLIVSKRFHKMNPLEMWMVLEPR